MSHSDFDDIYSNETGCSFVERDNMLTEFKIRQPYYVYLPGLGLLWAAIFVLLLCSRPADATTGDANTTSERKLSFKTAVQMALENNHQIKAFAYSVSASQQDVHIARGELLPKIAIEENLTRTDIPANVFSSKLNQQRFSSADLAGAPGTFNNPGYLNNYQTIFSIEQPLFAPMASIGHDIADKQSQAKGEEYQRAREEIVYRVIREYLTVHTAKEMVVACANSVNDADEHARISRAQYDANLGLYSDVLRASTAQKQAQQNLITAQKNLRMAKRSLGMAVGTQDSFDVESDFPTVMIEPIERYTAAAISRRDIRAMEKNIEIAQKSIDLTTAEYLPTAGLRADYQLDDHSTPFGSEGNGWFGGIFLKWYVFEGAKRDAQRSKASFELARTKENMYELENAISLQIYQAWLSVEEAQKNMELAKSAVETSEEGIRLVRNRYENSLSPLVDLLDTQLVLNNARANLVAKENEYSTAVATLLFESGTILSDLKLE
jgi:outer membrane protein